MRPPRDFGDYELLDLIGTGGMAWVYRARERDLSRFVAVKVLFPHLAEDPALASRFRYEAQSAAALDHPNIVQVIKRGEFDGWLFIAMPLLSGSDLKTLLEGQRRAGHTIPTDVSLLILRDACLALAHAHGRGIVHRDVKPSNIILTREGEVKLTDFGLARRIESDISITRTRPGEVMGSKPYMAPEQSAGRKLDSQGLRLVDVFAMGVTAYELLNGERPFPGETESEVTRAIHDNVPESLEIRNPLVARNVAEVVHRMLEKVSTRRCQAVSEALEALERSIEDQQIQNEKAKLRAYAQDPDGFYSEWRKQRLAKHSRAARLLSEQESDTRAETAHELLCVLHLDPDDREARQKLTDLGQSWDGPSPWVPPPPPPKVFRWWKIAVTLVIVIGLAAAAGLWLGPHERRPASVSDAVVDTATQVAQATVVAPAPDSSHEDSSQRRIVVPPPPPPWKPPQAAKDPSPGPHQTKSTTTPSAPGFVREPPEFPVRSVVPQDTVARLIVAAPSPPAPLQELQVKPAGEVLPCTLLVSCVGTYGWGRVTVDGRILKRDREPIQLMPNTRYEIKVTHPECEDSTWFEELPPGQKKIVSIRLRGRR